MSCWSAQVSSASAPHPALGTPLSLLHIPSPVLSARFSLWTVRKNVFCLFFLSVGFQNHHLQQQQQQDEVAKYDCASDTTNESDDSLVGRQSSDVRLKLCRLFWWTGHVQDGLRNFVENVVWLCCVADSSLVVVVADLKIC